MGSNLRKPRLIFKDPKGVSAGFHLLSRKLFPSIARLSRQSRCQSPFGAHTILPKGPTVDPVENPKVPHSTGVCGAKAPRGQGPFHNNARTRARAHSSCRFDEIFVLAALCYVPNTAAVKHTTKNHDRKTENQIRSDQPLSNTLILFYSDRVVLSEMAAEMSPQTVKVSPSSPPGVPLGANGSPPVTPNFTHTLPPPPPPNGPPVPGPPLAATASLESLRIQHLYTLALADRMRLLNPLWPAPRPMPPVPPPGGSPVDPFSPYKGLDPR